MTGATAATLDDLLPQTQCRRCGYEGCRPYAEALARGEADVDRCPPGGPATATALAAVLGRPAAFPVAEPATAVVIDGDACIGCAKCLRVCPVDAIVGAAGFLHAVLATECTGCNLCIPPCPVDCIAIVAAPSPLPLAGGARARRAARYRAHRERHDRARPGRAAVPASTTEQRAAYVQAAIARVRARRGGSKTGAGEDG